MSLVLFHHPWSRAANVIWMLEEVGVPYELRYVDIMKGEQKSPDVVGKNPMGKVPTLLDGAEVITESAAIGLYLADRYASGRLAPKLDDPRRGTYLRWSLFAPSVIEPAAMAKSGQWDFKESQAGWGNFASVLQSMESAIEGKKFVLGDDFSMADVIFGGTIRYMLMVKSIDATPTLSAYAERLAARPAAQRSDQRNREIAKAHGLG